jgi:hypothetical protein
VKFICFLIVTTLAAASARAGDITEMISQYRREHGLPAVKIDPNLTAIAERQAQAMASSGIMDHNVAGPFTSRIAGAKLYTAAENIAAGSKTWDDTLRMWKASPGHNKNLLLSGADIVGVAVARNENTRYKVYWAMVIGRRDAKHRPGKAATVTAAKEAEGDGLVSEAAAVQSSVTGWVNRTITSIKSLLP